MARSTQRLPKEFSWRQRDTGSTAYGGFKNQISIPDAWGDSALASHSAVCSWLVETALGAWRSCMDSNFVDGNLLVEIRHGT